jgi:hypothetical protein
MSLAKEKLEPPSPKKKKDTPYSMTLFTQGHVCFLESDFRETTFQTFLCLFAIRKVGQRKILCSQRKI